MLFGKEEQDRLAKAEAQIAELKALVADMAERIQQMEAKSERPRSHFS